ncbi:unnamed protein product [Mesocestoides corti]|uniref:DUF5734 domain-containing protein n=1 Tax=Mesocestoides corti TaxID=53468 RepID=A0A0R3U7N5_MESCO|nr:unnamed protein product [Mesocestoides corti]
MARPEFTCDLLYLRVRRCKAKKKVEKKAEKCLRRAIKSKPKVSSVSLYDDCLRFSNKKCVVDFAKVTHIIKYKEDLILVVRLNTDVNKKCLYVTMKFKTVNGYVNILYNMGVKASVDISENGDGRRQEPASKSANAKSPSRGCLQLQLDSPETILPRGRRSVSDSQTFRVETKIKKAKDCEETRQQSCVKEPTTIEIPPSWKLPRTKILGANRSFKRESGLEVSSLDSLYTSETSDFDAFFVPTDSDSETSLSRGRVNRWRGNRRSGNYNTSRRTGNAEFTWDSLGNPIRILRPRT